ncbi:ABC transporter substrate-binding protein (plasmid) [Ensifer adhaerens]|uniref:ABC transporter substrate-binding protein n=1 Tax=Ensifer adhaerens TaxID=106592 RepID=UPI0023A92CC0|nr:ABC transporter substrate-binding protein [Ensifer adhaerens]WDZ81554.1 ABC transporter substrate-binding protein [Ensifer adhaerens]
MVIGRLQRRHILAMAIAAGLCVAETTVSLATKVTIRIGHFPNITHVQALVARSFEHRGRSWFADRLGPGVVIEWYAYNAGPSAMEAIFAGSLDLAYVGPNPAINAYARSAGAEIRIVAGAVNGGSALVVQPGERLATPTDFRGRRIGTPQFGNTQDVAARAWLRDGGLRITQAGGDAYVVPTSNPEQLSLFKTRQLDAVWTVEPWVSRLELEAAGKVLIEERQAVTTVLVSRVGFLEQHRDLVHRFVQAHRELGEWISRHRQEAQAMVREELKADFRVTMSPDLVSRAWPRMSVTSDIALSALQEYVAKAQRVGFLAAVPDLSHLVEQP